MSMLFASAAPLAAQVVEDGFLVGGASRNLPGDSGPLGFDTGSFTLFTPPPAGPAARLAEPHWQQGAGTLTDNAAGPVLNLGLPGIGRLGLSVQGAETDPAATGASGPAERRMDLGARLDESFGPVQLTLAGRYGLTTGGPAERGDQSWATGLSIGFQGFTLGASYADRLGTETGAHAFDVGIGYREGPWGLSVSYLRGRGLDAGTADDAAEQTRYLMGLNFDLGQRVDLRAYGAFTESRAGEPAAGGRDEGFLIGTGINIDF